MRLLFIRHAIAMERQEFAPFGRDDSERPLTVDGQKKMKRNLRGLQRLIPKVDVLASSPFVRAQQTAELAAATFGCEIIECPALVPNQPPSALLDWLGDLRLHRSSQKQTTAGRSGPSSKTAVHRPAIVALVGHEPHLSETISWLLSSDHAICEMKKGGACLLSIASRFSERDAHLLWLLQPKQLRLIGRAHQ